MSGDTNYTFETKLLHNKHKFDPATGAVSVPIQHASTYHQQNIDSFGKYDYSRSLNPTREAESYWVISPLLSGGTFKIKLAPRPMLFK